MLSVPRYPIRLAVVLTSYRLRGLSRSSAGGSSNQLPSVTPETTSVSPIFSKRSSVKLYVTPLLFGIGLGSVADRVYRALEYVDTLSMIPRVGSLHPSATAGSVPVSPMTLNA